MMKLSVTLPAVWLAALLPLSAGAQFLEDPSPPPPSLKDLDLPVIVETISGLPLVDESSRGRDGFIKDEAAAVLLGKALFWDAQVGSQQVACATCHYHAGADARERNQLSPGLTGGNGEFDPAATGNGGPNYLLREGDFPFHQLSDPDDRDSMVIFDSDDVVSSQGVRFQTFNDINLGWAIDDCTPVEDPDGFQVGGVELRRVEPRNTPTVINAALNHRNFWDGRANNIFNGVDPFGQRNTGARILEVQGNGWVRRIEVAFENASLASQAVGPPVSNFEMSCDGRTWPKIGKKMLSVPALRWQRVHPDDSVLGDLSGWPRRGLFWNDIRVPYWYLISQAFADRLWDSNSLFNEAKFWIGTGRPQNTNQYTLMEANFSLFFGLAVMAYERTLISDDAPYDQWAEAAGEDREPTEDNTQGILTAQQMRGMDLFFTNTIGDPGDGERGNCSTCHQGPAFSTATFPFTEEEESGEFPEQEIVVERMNHGDGVNFIEDLFKFYVRGEGAVGGMTISGTAGARDNPSRYPAAVGGHDFTLNGALCKVESYLTDQDRTDEPPGPSNGRPPEPPGPPPTAIKSTKDVRVQVTGCLPAGSDAQRLEIRIIDNGPTGDTAEILEVMEPWSRGPCANCYDFPDVYGATLASGPVEGDFVLAGPVLYDTAFYNIGVRPTEEDLGVAREDDFGNPLSFTQQWINQLLGTPGPDVDALKTINFGRVVHPFHWLGDSVFYPDGFWGHVWMTHALETNPDFGNDRCVVQTFPEEITPPPPFDEAGQEECEAGGYQWEEEPPFELQPRLEEWMAGMFPGRGDDAVPLYWPPTGQTGNRQAILDMQTGIDGAFKVPILRNVTLTAPYFHTGGYLTLEQVMDFYNRGGDFAMENLGPLAPNIHPLELDDDEVADLVAFLDAFTDERVRCELAPFDHPEIQIQPGAQGDSASVEVGANGQAKDRTELIPATGAGGRPADGMPCLETENFLE